MRTYTQIALAGVVLTTLFLGVVHAAPPAPVVPDEASAAAATLQFTLAGCSASPSSANVGDTVTLTYNVQNNSIVTVTFGLGATITRLDTGQAINDPVNDVNATIGPLQTGVFTLVEWGLTSCCFDVGRALGAFVPTMAIRRITRRRLRYVSQTLWEV